ncbi:DUF1329 domain-containing protein [Halopseudomonas aestusnigri]|uniref:DUF1329 domain-containing protein n=1 Tax=Halopseudomonas aestusnigri TaxID=857252 RepID=UPI003001CC35|tara:strand:- start:2670 stop:4031 length:1362 start_codon:yes stop_codon:yes gene_type:complete
MNRNVIQLSILALTLLATGVRAAVPQQEAAQLGGVLTPLGAERAGNADGSIPAWTGGMSADAGVVDEAGFLTDPFADEQPLFVITAQNLEQYRQHLSPGQVALFNRYPESYRMRVYPSHRSAAMPERIYEYAKSNALSTQLVGNGYGLQNFTGYFPFPIPKSGIEVVWNHIARYRGGSVMRQFAQIVPDAKGGFSPVIMHDTLVSPEFLSDYDPQKQNNILFYWKQAVDAPARLAGNISLVHETIDQVKEPRMAWVYNAGQRRVRRAPQVAYDGPIATAEGHRVSDNFDMFNGAPDRYEWKLEGKKELFIPYNSYQLDSPQLKYSDIIRAGHMNPDLQRYELHRVWHVTATLKDGERHIYARRDFYIDEDTWQAAVIDHFDGRGDLWRVAEAHALQVYNQQLTWYAAETLHDLMSGRYLVLGLKNEQRRSFEFGAMANSSEFTPNALRQSGMR